MSGPVATPSPCAAETGVLHEVLIIGAGFAGLGMAMQLVRQGERRFVILEQGHEVGGTWRDNHYPGCACDVPSHLYSYSFEPHPGWSRMYAGHEEIQAYLLRCTEKYGLRPHLHLDTTVVEARFDEDQQHWQVLTQEGQCWRARVLVSALGGLSRPSVPTLPGIDHFQGPAFHSARWRHDIDWQGKRVAVVGTGASAIQIIPQLQRMAGQVHVLQRTPAWVLPKDDHPITARQQAWLRHVPGLQKLWRHLIYWRQELLAIGFVWHPKLMARGEKLATRYLYKHVRDPALRDKLLPRYTLGCKRILLSNDYYKALTQPNVHVHDSRELQRVTDRGLLMGEQEVPVDVIVYGTGFQAAQGPSPLRIIGRGGLNLDTVWARDGMNAYNGMQVNGFPNLFLLLGPNTALGHNSVVFMIETQVQLVLQALKALRRKDAGTIEVRPEAQARYRAMIDHRTLRTVWKSGCESWYLDAQGRNVTLWPGFTISYWWRLRRLRAQDFLWEPRSALARASRPV